MTTATSILLVDDNEIDNLIHKSLLEHLGINRIRVATDGKQALYLLPEQADSPDLEFIDLMLLDINMPTMNGFQLLERLTDLGYADWISRKVVILTSSGIQQDRITASQFGVKGFLTKPLTLEAAAALIGSAGVA